MKETRDLLFERATKVVDKQMELKEELEICKTSLGTFEKSLGINKITVGQLIKDVQMYKERVEQLDLKARQVAKDAYTEMATLVSLTITETEYKEEYESIEDYFKGIQNRVDADVYLAKELKNYLESIEKVKL